MNRGRRIRKTGWARAVVEKLYIVYEVDPRKTGIEKKLQAFGYIISQLGLEKTASLVLKGIFQTYKDSI